MNNAVLSALAAVGGSLVGTMGPVMSNYVIQIGQNRRDLQNHQITQRELIYAEFIRDASSLYVKSLTEDLRALDEIVALYSLVSRLRLLASEPVLEAAEKILGDISRQYGEPNLTIMQIQAVAVSGNADPLGPFSSACRDEFKELMK